MTILNTNNESIKVCNRCHKELTFPGSKRCIRCIEYSRAYQKRRYEEWSVVGLCPVCGKERVPGKSKCPKHMQSSRDRHYRRKANGTCLFCGAEREPGHVYCLKHIEFNRQRKKIYGMNDKCLIIDHYGGSCVCCNESIIEFMTIDHIDGGGRQHRIEVGKGHNFYKWLIKNNFPDDYRVLCTNCNSTRGLFGYCPHNPINKPILSTDKHAIRLRIAYLKCKNSVLDHYGRECVCCGENIFEFMTVDHMNGSGLKHRTAIKRRSMWSWLCANNYPNDFRILCWNCNSAIGSYGKCPHQHLNKIDVLRR